MLNYLIALLDDSNDFSWQAAKASHAVLLCRMEQGEVTSWSDTEKIESDGQMLKDILCLHRLPIAHKNFAKISLARKQASQCPVCITMIILVTFKNITRQKEFSTDIYVVHVLPRMARSVPTLPWIVRQKIQKKINYGHSR